DPMAPLTHAAASGRVTDIFAAEIQQAFAQARDWADQEKAREVTVNGEVKQVRYPFPSPIDWRDCWMYFLMVDRFSNAPANPKWPWNRNYDYRQGGTFRGITDQLNYLHELGVKALWLTPILKNPRPDWQYNYHGYNTQDFLHIDERFGSDGTLVTAE